MRNIEALGIKPVFKPVAAVQPGDCIAVLAGATPHYRQVHDVSGSGAIAQIQTRRFLDLKPQSSARYCDDAVLPVYERDAVEAALQSKILAVLPPNGQSKPCQEVFCEVRSLIGTSPGLARIRSSLRRMAEAGCLVEVWRRVKSAKEEPCYRQPIGAASLPLLVTQQSHYRAGWVVALKNMQPSRFLYAEVQWFDGSRSLVRDPDLDPLATCPQAQQAIRQAIAHSQGIVPADFVAVPRDLLRSLISPRNGLNINQLMELSKFLLSQGVELRCGMEREATQRWLRRHYPGWHYGIMPHELLVVPDGVETNGSGTFEKTDQNPCPASKPS